MQCSECNQDFSPLPYSTPVDHTLCPRCHFRRYGVYGRCSCAVHGCADGPGNHYTCFEKPNVYEETRLQLAAMERSGKLKEPEMMRKAQAVLAEAERQTAFAKTIDYEKDGHDLDRTNNYCDSGDCAQD